MTESSVSQNPGSDNFPFSDAPAPMSDGNETVIADEQQLMIPVSEIGRFEVTTDAHQRLSPGSQEFEPKGVTLGHFEIDSLIGSGGMGAVYKATDLTLQRTVALKILSLKYTDDKNLVARFLNEARSCARLNHENIARIFFIGEDQGIHYIAFEYVAGKNLRQLLEACDRLSPQEALNYTLQIAFALKQTWTERVVHRDIKPSNIIITDAQRAKLVDLGLARKSGDDSIGDLTVVGATLGTFDYIAPEQARDARAVDIRTDIYSLGCTLYNMLTGRAPYPDGTALQKLLERHATAPPDPRSINPAVNAQVAAIVQRMMEITPEKRYQNPDELIADLLVAGASNGLRGINPESLIWIQPGKQRESFFQRYAVWFATAAALFLMVALSDLMPDAGTSRLEIAEDAPIAAAPTGDAETTDTNTGPTESQPIESPAIDPGTPEQPVAPATAEPRMGGSKPKSLIDGVGAVTDIFNSFPPLTPGLLTDIGLGTPDTKTPEGAADAMDPRNPGEVTQPKEDRLISLESDDERRFQSLEAAIAEAEDGDVIKLRFDGLGVFAETRPAWVTNKNITIRAEAGYRPIIRFQIDEDLIDTENEIIKLVSSSVDLVDVDLQVVIPDSPLSSRWSLFSLQGTERVRLDNVNIRFMNASARTATVFELRSGSRLARMRNDGSMPDDEAFQVKIKDCWINGNCNLLEVTNAVQGTLEIANSALSLGNSLLYYTGSSDMEKSDRGRINLQMEHVTCLVGDNLIQIRRGVDASLEQQMLPVQVQANNNVFCSVTYSPLILMKGNSDMEEFRRLLTWNGNRNWYDRTGSLWQIDSSYDDASDDFDSDRWRTYWRDQTDSSENGATVNEPIWKYDWKNKSTVGLTLRDLTLSEETTAIGGATDGKDVGANWSQLPPNSTEPTKP